MKKNNINFLFRQFIGVLFILLTNSIFGQYIEQFPINRVNADKMLEIENYQEAVRQFSELLKEDPNNEEYQFNLAKAYNNSFIDQNKALKLLTKLHNSATAKNPREIKYELAIAYHKNYAFDEANKLFNSLLTEETEPEEKNKLEKWIKSTILAKDMVANPIEVELENLGKEINSEAPDYLPYVDPDESTIYFSTRRDGVVGNLYDYGGYKTADIYTAKHKDNSYTRARSVGSPNTYGNEETAGRSENGNYLIYHVNSDDNFSDLFISEKGRRSFMPPKELDSKIVNQKTSKETGAAITNDGRRIYFSSDREGGQGGFDIWIIRRLPTGAWGEPQNLGPPINTPGDELYPFLRGNESLLYFSSDGHPSMGGKDLFTSTMDERSGKWNKPNNMGYPINTPNDDLNICYAANSRYAYTATKRDDSYGDLDIYRLIFKDISPEYTLLSGSIMNPDSSLIQSNVLIEIFESKTGVLYGSYLMNPKTSKYHAILPPGDYKVEIVDTYGYENFETEITLLGKSQFEPSKQIDIFLDKNKNEQIPELDTNIEPKKLSE